MFNKVSGYHRSDTSEIHAIPVWLSQTNPFVQHSQYNCCVLAVADFDLTNFDLQRISNLYNEHLNLMTYTDLAQLKFSLDFKPTLLSCVPNVQCPVSVNDGRYIRGLENRFCVLVGQESESASAQAAVLLLHRGPSNATKTVDDCAHNVIILPTSRGFPVSIFPKYHTNASIFLGRSASPRRGASLVYSRSLSPSGHLRPEGTRPRMSETPSVGTNRRQVKEA